MSDPAEGPANNVRSLRVVPTVSGRVQTLLKMLTFRRPAGSATESHFISRYIAPLGTLPDAYGNHWLEIPLPDGSRSPVLFSSHTDTVHRIGQTQHVTLGDGYAWTESPASTCLGADCTVGVWLMVQMAKAGVPGVYVWHRDEESGGKGSSWIARQTPERFKGLDFAIAFDRRGTSEVITHQWGGRTASDAFADSFAKALATANPLLNYSASDKGTFTDTANYSDLIAECCNLGVGYYDQHSTKEVQDVQHAERLLDALLALDWTSLACERDPTVEDFAYTPGLPIRWNQGTKWYPAKADDWASRYDPGPTVSMGAFVYENPDVVARFLEDNGFRLDDLESYALERHNYATPTV